MAKKAVQIDEKKFHDAMDELRDLLNWLAIIEEEYDLTKKDARACRKHLERAVKFLVQGMR